MGEHPHIYPYYDQDSFLVEGRTSATGENIVPVLRKYSNGIGVQIRETTRVRLDSFASPAFWASFDILDLIEILPPEGLEKVQEVLARKKGAKVKPEYRGRNQNAKNKLVILGVFINKIKNWVHF